MNLSLKDYFKNYPVENQVTNVTLGGSLVYIDHPDQEIYYWAKIKTMVIITPQRTQCDCIKGVEAERFIKCAEHLVHNSTSKEVFKWGEREV